MKLIHKKNLLSIICIAYTLVSLSLTMYEILATGDMNPTQLNIFLFFILSVLGVGILSQHHRLDRFSPLTMILLQYLGALLIILGSLKLASFVVDIHPDGYHDMVVSFSIPYGIGAAIYYICLFLQVQQQNQLLALIKQKRK